MKFKEGDRVRQLFTRAERHGTIIGIYDEDVYFNTGEERFLHAIKGELKVKFDYENGEGSMPMSTSEVELIK